jgi:hypothetical protein
VLGTNVVANFTKKVWRVESLNKHEELSHKIINESMRQKFYIAVPYRKDPWIFTALEEKAAYYGME